MLVWQAGVKIMEATGSAGSSRSSSRAQESKGVSERVVVRVRRRTRLPCNGEASKSGDALARVGKVVQRMSRFGRV